MSSTSALGAPEAGHGVANSLTPAPPNVHNNTNTAPQDTNTAPQEVSPVRRTRGLQLAHLWLIVPLAFAWFAAGIDYIEPYDFWWNVKSGQIMAQTGRFLATDVLAWTPVREPYYNPQWGSQLLFYWLYALSPYLLLTVRAVIITATCALVLKLGAWKSGSLRAATVAALIAYLASWTNYGMRPQLLAILPFVAFYFLLERKDAYPKWLPMLVPIMLFWVNVHGSFFLGVALLGIYAAGTLLERIGSAQGRKWLLSRPALWQAGWFTAAALTSLANPYFTGIFNYFFVATNDPIARSLNIEWQSPTLSDGTGMLFFASLLLFVGAIYASRRRLRPTEILLILAFGYLSLTSLRNVMWWNWITAPIMAANLATIAANRKARQSQHGAMPIADPQPAARNPAGLPVLNTVIAVMLVGGALLFTPLWRRANPLVPTPAKVALAADTPTQMAAYLKTSNVPGPVFNYMEWGGYLENELYPQYRMFIDGRFEARQVQVWQDYLSVSRGRADWQRTLDRYGVRTLILSKAFHKDLIPFVLTSPAWQKVHEDGTGMVFVRR